MPKVEKYSIIHENLTLGCKARKQAMIDVVGWWEIWECRKLWVSFFWLHGNKLTTVLYNFNRSLDGPHRRQPRQRSSWLWWVSPFYVYSFSIFKFMYGISWLGSCFGIAFAFTENINNDYDEVCKFITYSNQESSRFCGRIFINTFLGLLKKWCGWIFVVAWYDDLTLEFFKTALH